MMQSPWKRQAYQCIVNLWITRKPTSEFITQSNNRK